MKGCYNLPPNDYSSTDRKILMKTFWCELCTEGKTDELVIGMSLSYKPLRNTDSHQYS